jgi:hypothetical protein
MLKYFQKARVSFGKPTFPKTENNKPQIVLVYERIVKDTGRMKQSGRATIANCPFHEDKKPSFSMYKDNNTYHCFSCGANGDSFDLIEKVLGVEFASAKEFATVNGLMQI